jgi:hydrogenase maturation protease
VTPPLVVGIGNTHRGDDRAGLAVARLLRASLRGQASVAESDGEVGALVEALGRERRVIVVDASRSGLRPGTVRRFQAHRDPLPAALGASSTHALGLAAAIDVARALGQLAAEVTVYAIEGRRFGIGDALSPEVQDAVRDVARDIASQLGVEA